MNYNCSLTAPKPLTSGHFRPASIVLLFTKADVQEGEHPGKAWGERVKQFKETLAASLFGRTGADSPDNVSSGRFSSQAGYLGCRNR